MQTVSRTYRLALAVLVASLAFAGLAAAAPTQSTPVKAPPSKNCAKAIVDDWYPDGDVDYIYPLDCYQKAIKSLSADLREYSQAPEDILRAYRFAKSNRPDPGRGATGGGTTTTETTPATETTPTETTPATETTSTETTPATDTTDTTDTGFGGNAGGGAGGPGQGGGGTTDGQPSGTEDSSSVPVPLIVLGGLAVLLVAAGGAGYVTRRTRAGQAPEDDPQSSP